MVYQNKRVDFRIGYSPECINSDDKVHRLSTITKIVPGMDEETLDTATKLIDIGRVWTQASDSNLGADAEEE